MQLIVSSRGSFVHVHEQCFEIRSGGQKHQFSYQRIDSIVISVAAAISTDALRAAVENNVDVIVVDEFGNPLGRFWHCRYGSTARIRRCQLALAETAEGLEFPREWIARKLTNQVNLLLDLARNRPDHTIAFLPPLIERLRQVQGVLKEVEGDLDTCRGTIMGLEGTAGRIYFDALSQLIPETWKFSGRSCNPARDAFNCYLNYAYGVLYSMTERGCILAGLDPYLGFLHTDGYGKKSLVFDLIEVHRVWAEEVVFKLFSRRKIKNETMDQLHDGFSLNKDGKAILMEAFNQFLDEVITFRKKRLKRRDTVQAYCHTLAQKLLKVGNPLPLETKNL